MLRSALVAGLAALAAAAVSLLLYQKQRKRISSRKHFDADDSDNETTDRVYDTVVHPTRSQEGVPQQQNQQSRDDKILSIQPRYAAP